MRRTLTIKSSSTACRRPRAEPVRLVPELSPAARLPCPPRYGTPRNPTRQTLGPAVGRVMTSLGLAPTPWQQHVLDVALELNPDGSLVYREVRLWVPRQSGKTALLMGLMLHRCLAWTDQRVVYTAQTRNHARAKFVDEHLEILKLSRWRRHYRERLSNGSEHIKFPKPHGRPSRWGIDSTTKKAGHGDSVDLVIADEFFAQEDDRLESGVRPTMITRSSPQMWFVSTFGEDDAKVAMGAPLWSKVDDGRARCKRHKQGLPRAFGTVAYFEWSAADVDSDDIDYGDVELWRRTMPALQCNGGIITEAAIRADFESMSLPAFKRAYLNLRPKRHEVVRVFPGTTWPDSTDSESSLEGGRLSLAWDVSPDGDSASVGFVGRRPDGRWHGEVIKNAPGTDWLPARVADAAQRAGARLASIGVLPGATAGAFIEDVRRELEARGIKVRETPSGKGLAIVEVTMQHYAQGCGALYAAVSGGQWRHRGQRWLTNAVDGARRAPAGSAWVWDRKRWATDITPLCCLTVAMRAFEEAPAPASQFFSY